jgi:prepilin-type N-terminal cleavage/methylation domain-containing protein/prepilin-type processing-associated H-X9-DG protein
MKTFRGFTLIELLVVIAIIAILAAILFPVFATAREKARATTCSSNLKQVGLGMIQYVQDYDETYPYGIGGWCTPVTDTPPCNWTRNYSGWAGEIYPYVKSTKSFQCPDDTSIPAAGNARLQISYGMNYQAMGIQASKFTSTANTVAMFEVTGAQIRTCTGCAPDAVYDYMSPSGDGWPTGGVTNSYGDYKGTTYAVYATGNMGQVFSTTSCTAAAPCYTEAYHNNGANWLATDGHVKWLMGTKISNGSNAPTPSTPASTGSGAACGASAMYHYNTGAQYTLTFSYM